MGRTVCLKLRYGDFTTFTRQTRSRIPLGNPAEINRISRDLFLTNWDRNRRIRLLGISVSSLEEETAGTGLPLFPKPDPGDLVF
jgi:DNA polymerase-4